MALIGGVIINWMVQFDAHGRFVRKAKYNRALLNIWQRQLPNGRIQLLP